MERRADDGPFASFVEAVLAHAPHFDDLSVSLTTMRGDHLAFGWEGPLLLNGSEQPITGFRHYDNRFCQAELGSEEMLYSSSTKINKCASTFPLAHKKHKQKIVVIRFP